MKLKDMFPSIEDVFDEDLHSCAFCGKVFYRYIGYRPRKVGRNPRYYFCSKDCFNDMRMAVYRKFDFKCNQCNSSINLQIHHINPLSNNGSHTLDNLELLCEFCHKNKHRIKEDEHGKED